MSVLSDIREALSSLNKWNRAMFALACAERSIPVFVALAQPKSIAVVNAALSTGWSAAEAERSVDKTLIAQVAALPENTLDDSHCAEYQAGFALSIVEYALSTSGSGELESADLACCQAFDFHSSLDAIVNGSPPIVVDPNMPAPLGELARNEISAQRHSLEVLTSSAGSRKDMATSLQSRAKLSSQALATVIRILSNWKSGS